MTIVTISLGSKDFNLLINELMKIYYNVRIIPKTVTAETAATLKAKFRFLSIFFSSFILDNKSVSFTLLCALTSSEWFSNLYCELIYLLKHE